ncbi:dual specificity protein phosphatase family protein [Roseibium aggregatum]|uniref:Protein tyrosine phosphatase n=1 Tax=Roseibium aggregatum TaxID=187304 RepID=A0A926S8T5_9HYPH|nr:dual specificity protein phosphatase family protein [Roseibium aggregatum]MBD1549292.1 protein tyrosine phosphatase [Roseibium aggregatum]
MPKPSGDWLEDDIGVLRGEGIDHVVSMLTGDEIEELGLAEEQDICLRFGVAFSRFAIEDRGVPELAELVPVVERLVQDLTSGRSVAVHCRAGIGRSGLLAACVLTRFGLSAEHAIESVSLARGVPIPDTAEQAEFVHAFTGQCGP